MRRKKLQGSCHSWSFGWAAWIRLSFGLAVRVISGSGNVIISNSEPTVSIRIRSRLQTCSERRRAVACYGMQMDIYLHCSVGLKIHMKWTTHPTLYANSTASV